MELAGVPLAFKMTSSSQTCSKAEEATILHKIGYNYGIDGVSKYYNPFYVT